MYPCMSHVQRSADSRNVCRTACTGLCTHHTSHTLRHLQSYNRVSHCFLDRAMRCKLGGRATWAPGLPPFCLATSRWPPSKLLPPSSSCGQAAACVFPASMCVGVGKGKGVQLHSRRYAQQLSLDGRTPSNSCMPCVPQAGPRWVP